jgi:hypothetical protein
MSNQIFYHQVPAFKAPRRRLKPKVKAKGGRGSTTTVHRVHFTADSLLENTAIATFVTKSSDGRRQYRQTEEVAAPTPSSSLNPIDINLDDNDFHDDPPLPFTNLLEKEIADEAATKARARRYVSSVSTR